MTTFPFENDTRGIVNKLGTQRLKISKNRNFFIIFAMILTTVLFATFFSVGGGFLDQVKQNKQLQYGTAHATVKFLPQKQYDTLAKSDYLKDISYTRLVGTATNPPLSKMVTEVRFAEDNSAKSFLAYPTMGKMPQMVNEIATSTLVLDALGIQHEVGTIFHLSISVDGELTESNFVLTGFWEGYPLAQAQQIWVSKAYADVIAPAATKLYNETGKYSGLYCADINFAHTWNIDNQFNLLANDAHILEFPNSINPSYEFILSEVTLDIPFVLAIVALLCIILLAGYLIIYNLFYISVTQDIHFFGMLRTIGASGKQLKGIVRKQAFRLAIIGLPIGLFIGYFIGRLLLPFILTQIEVADTGVYRINPLILIGAVAFALLTVYISSLKPCNYAAKIPAIEAVRYSRDNSGIRIKTKKSKKATTLAMAIANLKRNKKKAILVVLSLSLSLILLNTTYTAINGFDLDGFIAKNAVADFYVTDFSVRNYSYENKNLAGVSNDFLAELASLPGLENSASVYVNEVQQKIPDYMVTQFEKMRTGINSEMDKQFIARKSTPTQVYGIDNTLSDKVMLTSGEWDEQLWATGNYVIINDFFYQGLMENSQSPFYQVGDIIVLSDNNGKNQNYTIMGIGSLNYNLDAQYYSDYGLRVILPQKSYIRLYGQSQPLGTVFNVNDENTANTENWISNYCENVETTLTYISHRVYEQEFEKDKTTYTVVGGILTIILALIGLLNFINAVATSVISRQKELAILGAIGMSRNQIKKMLIFESLGYIVLSILITVTIGTAVCYFVCSNLVSNMWAFVYHFTLTPVLLCLPFFLAVAFVIPLWYNKKINQKSIVERLRLS